MKFRIFALLMAAALLLTALVSVSVLPAAAKAIARRIAFGFTDLHATAREVEAARAEVLTLLS